MKLWWSLLIVGVALPMIISAANIESDLWEEDDKEATYGLRTARDTKDHASGGSPSCRYIKGQWSDCEPNSNMRTRTFTLKKGDKSCEKTKTVTKKCKKGKACRYEKGSWSSCVNQSMTRVDNLKANSDPSCEKTRRISKRCKPDTNTKKATKSAKNGSNKKGSTQ